MIQPYFLLPNDNQFPLPPGYPSARPEKRSLVLDGKRAVIVEDEGITQMQLRRILKEAGLIVLTSAINGEEGVEIVLREHPDLVLMDICMPGSVDGLEAAQRIMAEYSVCIVMLTAFSDAEYRERATELKACGYIVKPVSRESLLPQLEDAYSKFGRS